MQKWLAFIIFTHHSSSSSTAPKFSGMKMERQALGFCSFVLHIKSLPSKFNKNLIMFPFQWLYWNVGGCGCCECSQRMICLVISTTRKPQNQAYQRMVDGIFLYILQSCFFKKLNGMEYICLINRSPFNIKLPILFCLIHVLHRCRLQFALKSVVKDIQENKKKSTNVASTVQSVQMELTSTVQVKDCKYERDLIN